MQNMRRQRKHTAVILALLLLGVAASTDSQAERDTRHRAPAPGIEKAEEAATEEPVVKILAPAWGFIIHLHSQVALLVPPTIAWALLIAVPILLPVGLIGLSRWWDRYQIRRAVAKRLKERETQKKQGSVNISNIAKKEVEATRPVNVTGYGPEQRVLAERDQTGHSFYQFFIGLGADADAVQQLRAVAKGTLQPAQWIASVEIEKPDQLTALRRLWVCETCGQRLRGWLMQQPSISIKELTIELPSTWETENAVGLCLIGSDGLGVKPEGETKAALLSAREALENVLRNRDDPLARVAAERRLGQSIFTVQSREPDETSSVEVTLLLDGLLGADACTESGLLSRNPDSELRAALTQHRDVVGTPVPAEGCAVYALQMTNGGNVPGFGTLLAAISGAAFSTSSIVLQMSRNSGSVKSSTLRHSMQQMGKLVIDALANPKGGDGKIMMMNARRLLGLVRLEVEKKRSAELMRDLQRWSAKDPIWPQYRDKVQPIDHALVNLHARRLDECLRNGTSALARFCEILEKLSYEGDQSHSQQVAYGRIGYTVAGFGMAFLKGTSTELLSLGREVIAGLRKSPPIPEPLDRSNADQDELLI